MSREDSNQIVCPKCGKVTTLECYYSERVYGHGTISFNQPEFDEEAKGGAPVFYNGDQWEMDETEQDDTDDYDASDIHCGSCSQMLTFEEIAEGRKQFLTGKRDLTAPKD